jgi:hypothetical protein
MATKSHDAQRDELRRQTDDLTDNVARLAQACIVSITEAGAGSVRVIANLIADVATAVIQPSKTEADDGRGRLTGIVSSANRALRDMVDVVDRSERQFSTMFQPPREAERRRKPDHHASE